MSSACQADGDDKETGTAPNSSVPSLSTACGTGLLVPVCTCELINFTVLRKDNSGLGRASGWIQRCAHAARKSCSSRSAVPRTVLMAHQLELELVPSV